jgi:hypothetical protein
MSQFEYAKQQQPPPRSPSQPATIEVDTLLHWGLLAVLIIGILVVTYLLITKCTAYWSYRIEQWRYGGRKKRDSSDDDDEYE